MEISRFAINTTTLAGTLEEKLRVIAEAGFSAIDLEAKDVIGHADGADAAIRKVRDSGLSISGFQLLRDFEGLPGQMLDYKLDIAKSDMQLMHKLGARLLLLCSSTSPHASNDVQKIADDLATLATLATPLGIRIGYEALSWGRWVNDYSGAWKIVEAVNRHNVGLVIDSFHLLARGASLTPLDDIPSERIFLIQLSDYTAVHLSTLEEIIETAGRRRVFPGEGAHGNTISELVARVEHAGYRGNYTLGVFNEDYRRCPPSAVMARARKSLEWLVK